MSRDARFGRGGPRGEPDRTEEMAAWSAGLRFEEIPARIVEKAKLQVMSVLGAMLAGASTEEGPRVVEVVRRWGGPEEATLVPEGSRTSGAHAAYAMAALGMVLDYDDYLFPCHTGHSAVVVPMVLAEKLGLSGRQWLAAQVAANEVEGRLAASVLLGPFNGQMCSFVHLLGAAAAGAKLAGLGPEATAHALRIAFYQTPHGLYGGFMGTGAKALTASVGILWGLAAADMAAAGMRGAGDILAGSRGFVREFSFVPLPYLLSGYGRTWLTDTLSYKIYPGCAYIDAAVDCAIRLVREQGVRAAEIARVTVRASLLTTKMEALARPFVRGPETLPQTLNFTIPYNVAAALIDGDLTPARFRRGATADPEVWDLASRVSLVHDPARTLALRRSSEAFLDLKWLASSRRGDLVAFLRHHLAPGEVGSVLKALAVPATFLQVARDARRRLGARRGGSDLGEVDLAGYRMEFGATVEVETRRGRKVSASQDVPLGAAGHPFEDTRRLVERKLIGAAAPRIGEEAARRVVGIVARLEEAGPDEVRSIPRLLCGQGAARRRAMRSTQRPP